MGCARFVCPDCKLACIGNDKLFLDSDRSLDAAANLIDDKAEEVDDDEADPEAEDESPAGEAGVPDVVAEESNAEVEEDHAVADGAEHLDEVLDGGAGVGRDVLEGVVGLDQAAADQADDAGPVEQLGKDVAQVGHAQHGEGLQHLHLQ